MDSLQQKVFQRLSDLCGFDGPEEVQMDAFLGKDYGLSSLQLVTLASQIQDEYPDSTFQFQDLLIRKDGSIKTDVRLDELIDYLRNKMTPQ